MLEIEFPTDFVVSTGKSHSVLDFVEAAFRAVGLEKEKENYLKSSPDLIRKNDHGNLVGNAQKAQENLNWKPTLSFEKIVSRMVEEDLKRLTQGTLN
jgi:GDPmannose 4,6-dehydratase